MTGAGKWTWVAALLAALTVPGPALADWARLEGPALEAALAGAEITLDGGGWQHVLPAGRVVTRSGEAPSGATSWAEWRVDAEGYCTRMPVATEWVCYTVEVDGLGGIRFIDGYGNASAGRLGTAAE